MIILRILLGSLLATNLLLYHIAYFENYLIKISMKCHLTTHYILPFLDIYDYHFINRLRRTLSYCRSALWYYSIWPPRVTFRLYLRSSSTALHMLGGDVIPESDV